MYSIACDGLRYTATYLINQEKVTLVDTIVDTGALYTCYKAEQIDESLREDCFSGVEYKYIGGFVDGEHGKNAVKFYRYSVKQFTIGTIDMGERSVWVTFDKRVNDNVLGMDIHRSATILQFGDSDELSFFIDINELREYVNGEVGYGGCRCCKK